MAEESQETESSPVSDEVQVDESTTEVAEDTASSLDATEVEAETTQTLADAVQDALQPEEPVEETETSEEVEVTESIETSGEISKEDYKDVPFNKHPRFRSLVAEKNELKDLTAKLKGDSEQYSKITGFIDRNNLSAKEAVEGFKIMAAIRNNPDEAYKMLEHHLGNVSKITGKVLPEDLQSKVDDGFLDEDAAKELSQTRASLAREQYLRKADSAKSVSRQQSAQSEVMGTALQTWGETTLAKDPDFGLKQEEFNDRVVALVNERGRPQTQADVLGLVDEAYETVNERFRARQPQPTQLRTATGGKLSGTPRAEPKSLSDAISMAFESS
jgi:hypothetical protein